jgi:hypothetical protein
MALNAKTDPSYSPKRINGKFAPGVSGNPGGSPARARERLNVETIWEMQLAFKRGGRKAIDKVMKNQPAIFLKLFVLLVPREMRVEHTGGVKAMTDEQLEAGIEAITAMLEARLPGDRAKVVDGEVMPDAPALPGPRKARRKVGRDDNNVGIDVGTDDNAPNS